MTDAPSPRCSSGSYELRFGYTNWEGRNSERRVQPISVRYGQSKWHPRDGWLMLAFDLDKNEEREFSMRDMVMVERSDPIGGVAQGSQEPVAWRYRDEKYLEWILSTDRPHDKWDYMDALYTSPPAALPAGEIQQRLIAAGCCTPDGTVVYASTRDVLRALSISSTDGGPAA